MPAGAFAAIAADSMARGATFDCRALELALGTLSRRDSAPGGGGGRKVSEVRHLNGPGVRVCQ